MLITKIKELVTIKRFLAVLALIGLIIFNFQMTDAQSVAQAYNSETPLQRGMIVGSKKDDATTVEPVNVEQLDRIMGVVIDANDSPITLSGGENQVFVSTGGRYDVLVGDQNGEIKPGDFITASSISGIGMLASFNESHILGRAIDGFNGKDGVLSSNNITDNFGGGKKVNIGRVKVDIAIAQNPISKRSAATPQWLGKLGELIAGKTISPARLYISAGLFVVGAVISLIVLYSGVRSSIISIGRNPLSKKSIFRGMLQVIFTSLIIFIISVFGVYLLLRV